MGKKSAAELARPHTKKQETRLEAKKADKDKK